MAEPRPAGTRRPHAIALLIVFAAVFTVFAASVHLPFTDWDDPHYVTENPDIRGFSRAHVKAMLTDTWGIYVPLSRLTYALDYSLYGLDPFGYHLTNLVLHLANSILVYGLVFAFSGEWAVALAVALIFGIHPVQVESVVWVAERKNVLSAFWLLLSFAAFRKNAAAAFALFLLACLSKPSVVVFPLVIWAYDRFAGGARPRSWKFYAPFFALSAVFAALTVIMNDQETRIVHYGGSLLGALRVMPVILLKYLELLVFPVDLRLLYDLPLYQSFFEPRVLAALAGAGLLAAALAVAYFRNRKIFFCGLWFLIFLLPVMQLVPFPSLMNDRYLYLPLIGFFAAVFILLQRFAGTRATLAVALLAGTAFAGLNLHRQAAWKDMPRIWLETRWWFQPASLRQTPGEGENPDIAEARRLLFEEDEPRRAIEYFQKVLAGTGDPRALDGLGIAYFKQGKLDLAVGFMRKAVELSPREAGFYTNLALAYMPVRDFKSAYAAFLKAVELDPRNPVFLNNLGCFLDSWGKAAESEKAFQRSLDSDPDFAPALFNLGNLYFRLKRWEDARRVWTRLIEAHPDHEMVPTLRAQVSKLPH